jgi:hypothetical protein
MQSKAATVDEYLASLPEDRRRALNAVRKVILRNIDKKNIEEGMQYGMIGYYVPHRVYPPGYHCNPKEPLPMAGMASQKNHMSLYLMCVYGSDAEAKRFQHEWAKTGKKLDMGKACIRFKTVDDLALDVIAATFKRVTAKKYIEHYEGAIKAKPKAGSQVAKQSKKKVAKRASR